MRKTRKKVCHVCEKRTGVDLQAHLRREQGGNCEDDEMLCKINMDLGKIHILNLGKFGCCCPI